ncbi:MAG TPA: hypothetical protein VLN48_09845 [Bryobacteraceae bacterium]|nr:hypothetical protein [Bryobacteraceae bacterium]
MFEFLFKYPLSIYRQGTFIFLAGWPLWLLALGVLAAAAVLGFLIWRQGSGTSRMGVIRRVSIWGLQTALAALVLFLIWHPALSVSALKPQQNIVAVVIDDSSSMTTDDENSTRKEAAEKILNGGLLKALQAKFQVRLYRMSDHAERIDKLEQLTAGATATHIGESLKQVAADASSLPIGAMILLSDGADNTGGVDLETLAEIRRQRIPVHTIGLGRETMSHDVEISNVDVAARALPESRLAATVSFHQHGYTGQKAKITLKEGSRVVANQDITLKAEGTEQVESVLFNAGPAGVKTLEASIEPFPNEENPRNNRVTRLINVDARKPRILYMEGEPRWEFKFLRRAVEDDKNIDLFTILRTAPNKLYRQEQVDGKQGVVNTNELKDGFPSKIEELFGFDGLIFGSVDAPYLTKNQQDMVKQFVDRRGGGVLFLGGKDSLSDGGWAKSSAADILPTTLPERKNTYSFAGADVELTSEGRDSLITRIEEDPNKNVERWKKLPYIRTFQDPGDPKLGAVVLANFIPREGGGAKRPLLVTMNYGRGRTAIFATGGSWRWQMLQPVADMSHEMFYRQLLRWVVSDTPRHITGSTPKTLLADESRITLRADVRDKTYLPASDANVEAHITGDGISEQVVNMTPAPLEQGIYSADWTVPQGGSYIVEVVAKRGAEEIGKDTFTFRREDGIAENFHVEQNRELLQKLSSETGGQYYKPGDAQKLGKDINYSQAGITVRETRDLWDLPAIFLLFLGIRAAEWLLRRKWGVI